MKPNWTPRTVGEVVVAHYSGPSPTCEERRARAGEWGLLRTTAITWEHGWDWRQHKVPPRSYWGAKAIEVQTDDVLVTKAGPRHRVGVVAHVDDTPPYLMASGKMVGLRPNAAEVLPTLLGELLATSEAQRYLDHRTTGMAESQVNFANEALLATPLVLPPLCEQSAIADVIRTLDATIHAAQGLIAKLALLRTALVEDVMSHGLDSTGELRGANGDGFTASPIGTIPAAWTVAPLGSITQRLTDGTHQAVTVTARSAATVPFLYVSCIRSGEILWPRAASIDQRTYKNISKGREPKRGMILYTAVGSYGHAALVAIHREFAFQRHIACIYPNEAMVDPAFLAYWLDCQRIKRYADRVALGNAQLTVTLGELARYPVPLPPIAEQRAIARCIRAVEARQVAERRLLEKLRMLRKGLATDLLRGSVRVQAQPRALVS